jgi:hypothetical protein
MGKRALSLAIAAVGLLGAAAATSARVEPCPAARYVVLGTLLPGAPVSQVDVIALGGSPPEAELSVGCAAAHLKGAVKWRGTRRGTKFVAQWRGCAGLAKIRLKGLVTDACSRLTATLRADGLKTRPTANRSSCGDGFVDTDGGEACEPSGNACPGECRADCSCSMPTTTTTSTSATTSTTPTTSTTLPGVCDPLAAPGAQGCSPGEKCTWIRVTELPSPLGMVGCVPDGTVPLEGACTQGPAGETTGYDDCAAGLYCVNSACRDLCGFDGSPSAACAAGHACTRYSGVFANGEDDPTAGACIESCNPLTQLTHSGDACPANEGCYLLSNTTDTVAVCAYAGTLGHGATITGPAHANTCLPRHMPRLRAQGMNTVECGALCQPAEVYMGHNESSEEGVAPYTCTAAGAAPATDPMDGEACFFWWMREPTDDVTAFSNTVGWCFRFAAFQYDSNNDSTPDAPYPRCPTVTTGDVLPPLNGSSDALFFGCVELTSSLPAPLPAPRRMFLDRLDGRR